MGDWEMSSCGAGTAYSPTSSRSSWTMPLQGSPTSCAGRTCSRAPAGRSPCSAPCSLPTPRYAHLPLLLERTGGEALEIPPLGGARCGPGRRADAEGPAAPGPPPSRGARGCDARHPARMGDRPLARTAAAARARGDLAGFRTLSRNDSGSGTGTCPAAAGGRVSGKNDAFCPRRRWAGQEPRASALTRHRDVPGRRRSAGRTDGARAGADHDFWQDVRPPHAELGRAAAARRSPDPAL